jgi:hypothetical protein
VQRRFVRTEQRWRIWLLRQRRAHALCKQRRQLAVARLRGVVAGRAPLCAPQLQRGEVRVVKAQQRRSGVVAAAEGEVQRAPAKLRAGRGVAARGVKVAPARRGAGVAGGGAPCFARAPARGRRPAK